MKYRMLNEDELLHLEVELKQFLIVNGVHAEEWERINRDTPEKAVELIALFSDNILQKVYEKMEVLEFRFKDSCSVFHFKQDKIELISFHTEQNSPLDLSTPELIHEALKNSINELTFFRSVKYYPLGREMELHRMLMQGSVPSSKEFWNYLDQAIPRTK